MRARSVLWMLCLATCSLPAAADDAATSISPAAAADEAATPLAPLQVTGTRGTGQAADLPQPVTVIERAALERQSPQVLAEYLRGQPGAFFQQTAPGQGMVIVRGLKGAEVLHLVDGMRLNNAFFRTAPSQYVALVDPYNIAQLELLRGPGAALYGPDAMGGVVQVRTPEARFAGASLQFRGEALARYGSASLARVGRIGGALGDEDFSLAGGYTWMEYGNRRAGDPGQSPDGAGGAAPAERVAGSAYRARGFDLKTLWTPGGPHELMLAVQQFELPALPRYNELVPGFDNDGVAGPEFVESVYGNERAFYHLRYRYNAPLAFMDTLELHLGEQIIIDDRRERATGSQIRAEEFNRSALTGLTAQASSAWQAHRLDYGLDLYRDDIDSARRDTDLATGEVTPNGRDSRVKSRFPDGARSDNYGLFVADEWSATVRWALHSGLRYTYTRTTLPQADRAFAASDVDGHDFSGSAGSLLRLTDALAWTLNIGRGFRAPNVNDLAQVGRRSNNRITIANPHLSAETLDSIDSGFKLAGASLLGEASVFYSRYRDRIALVATGNTIPDGTSGCNQSPGCIEVQNRNVARAHYYGFEGGLRWLARPALTLQASLNYTFGAQQDRGVKTPANRVPPLNGEIGLHWQALPPLRIAPSIYFAARQNRLDAADRADNRIDPAGTPGYSLLNLQLEYAPRAGLSLQLEGINLLDRNYREHGSGIEGEGRGIVLGARARFG